MKRPALLLTAAALAAGLAGLAHGPRRADAQKNVSLPDVPAGPDGKATLLPNGWQITPAGRPLALPGDLPLDMALTPDGKYLLVNTAGYHDHTVALIDVASEKVVQTVNVGKDWAGLCLDPEGDDVYVSGGGAPEKAFLTEAPRQGATPEMVESFKHPLLRLSLADGKLTPRPSLDVPGLSDKDRWVAGLAAGPDGSLYVVNTQNDTVYKLAGAPRALVASAKVGYRPYGLALSPDGKTLAVSNWGAASVSLLDPGTLQETARVPVGSHPNALAWFSPLPSEGGGRGVGSRLRLFVANAGANSVSVIAGGKVTETIKTSLTPDAPVGSTPDALAVSPDGQRLYVANADNNDVAVVDIADAAESKVLGFLPTGWYPSALAVSPDGKRLFVGTGKGLRFRANADATTPYTRVNYDNGRKYDYIGGVLSGAVSVVDVPDADTLKTYTQQVMANTPGVIQKTAQLGPDLADTFHKIKHVVYIIRENRTYDQVFGDIKTGNGDPSLVLFGESVTPNAHALAANYVLLDNLYCNGEVSEDGHQWCDAAYATDYNERAWTNSYSGRGEPDADSRLTASPAGYLWDDAARHGLTYFNYGETAGFKSGPDTPPVFAGSKDLKHHSSDAYTKIPFATHSDLDHARIFLADLAKAERTGNWPNLITMSLGEDHTEALKAGAYTPIAHVAANDQALGQIVQGVTHSKFWPETAIFVIEDDAQNGPDHVDAHRTVGLVISPYVRRGVDSTLYTTASFVRTMELILGLPPMTQYDAGATPLTASFTPTPTLTAYDDLAPKVDMEARNPTKGPGAVASAKLDLSAPDRADPDTLNALLWHALKPGRPLPAPVRSALTLR